MKNSPKVCYFGTYEKNYARNITFIEAIRAVNVEVIEINKEVRETDSKKYGSFVGLLRLGIKFILAYVELFFKLIFLKDMKTIFIGYPSHLDVIFFYPLFKLKGQKILFNPLVSLYDTFVLDRKLFKEKSIIARLIFYIDKLSFSLSDLIFIDTNTHKNYLSELFRIDKEKFIVVPVGAVDELYKEVSVKKNDRFTVLYVGKYIPLHGIETILKAADILKDKDIWFRMIGKGQEYKKALQFAKEKRINNIEFIEWIDRDKLVNEIRSSHIVLGIFKKEGKALRVVPNKVYDALAGEAVVITERSPAVLEFFKDGEELFLVEPENPEELAKKILFIKENYDKLESAGKKGRKKILEISSKQKIGEILKNALSEVR